MSSGLHECKFNEKGVCTVSPWCEKHAPPAPAIKPGLLHVHDYDMMFEDKDTLNYSLRCKCGDVAPSMEAAMDRTRYSMLRKQFAIMLPLCLLLIGALWTCL